MWPRDHDRPGCGARSVAEFPGSRRLHGVPRRKCVGRVYQRPGWGRSCGTERTRRGGNRWNRGGAQSHRLWDRGATKVARLAEAGDCRAAEATEVVRWARARGGCAAEAAQTAERGGAGCWAENPARKEAWIRSAFARVAAVDCFWALKEATRASRSMWVRVISLMAVAESWNPWHSVV